MFLMQEFFIVLTSNILFSKLLGTDILTFGKKNGKSLNVLAVYVAVFAMLCSAVTALTDKFVSDKFLPLVDTFIVFVLYFAGFGLSKLFGKKAFDNYKVYMHFAAFNTATMGILFIGHNDLDLTEHFIHAAESAVGFFVAAWMLNIVYGFLSGKYIPKSFRGYPAVMIFIGLVSMAVYSL